MFALYSLLTRYAARRDAASVSFYWTGLVGAVAMTPLGLWFWEPMTGVDWLWMGALCLTAVTAHFLLVITSYSIHYTKLYERRGAGIGGA